METEVVTKGALCYIKVKDYFDPDTLLAIYKELEFLKTSSGNAEFAKAAKSDDGNFLKTGSGVFVDNLYQENRENSSVLSGCRTLFNNPNIGKKAEKYNAFFGHIDKSDRDFTLVNFYSSGQEYKVHYDKAAITAITFLKIGEFTGGDFVFPDYNERICFEENLSIIFPGCVNHQAEPIYGDKDVYRVSIAQFLNYV
jgi:hypothetical protein